MVKKLALLAALLGIALGAAAQDPESAYSGIFRGKLPGVYPYKYNGTYFWDRKEFLRGDILYNGKLYRDVLMNVDAARQDEPSRGVDHLARLAEIVPERRDPAVADADVAAEGVGGGGDRAAADDGVE